MQKKSSTKLEGWKIQDLVNARNGVSESKILIQIPKYQRNLVWSNSKKSSLIDSLKKGFPIGAMLVYKTGKKEGENEIYHLIDGLQRSSTLVDYTENPTKFLNPKNSPEDFDDIKNEVLSGFKGTYDILELTNKIDSLLEEWLISLNGFDDSNYASGNLIEFFERKLGVELGSKEFRELNSKLPKELNSLKEKSDISQLEIPLLIYNGDESNLPNIFEKLNRGGTQLSKYQVYAAVWNDTEIKITDIEIVNKIKEKYQELEDEYSMIFADNEEKIDINTQFNHFEYFFGLGKKIVDKHNNNLFKAGKEKSNTESIGFNLGTLCLEGDLKNMDGLPKKIKQNSIDLNKFTIAIMDSIDITWDILKPYLGIKANNKQGNIIDGVFHGELQIVSIIGKIFNSKYNNINFEIKSNWNESYKKLKENIPYHYLIDILQGEWSGTGDSKANKKSSDTTYETGIKKEKWDSFLDLYKDKENNRNERERISTPQSQLLFLKYIYGKILSNHDALSTDFEIEHICPVNKLKNVAQKLENDKGLPISSIANLALIEKSLNREKGDKTIYEYINSNNTQYSDSQIKKIEDERFLITESDLKFLDNFSAENTDGYYDFLDVRFERLKNKFYELNGIS